MLVRKKQKVIREEKPNIELKDLGEDNEFLKDTNNRDKDSVFLNII
jgi:hypothetical protein